jgi:hypothetical protein
LNREGIYNGIELRVFEEEKEEQRNDWTGCNFEELFLFV